MQPASSQHHESNFVLSQSLLASSKWLSKSTSFCCTPSLMYPSRVASVFSASTSTNSCEDRLPSVPRGTNRKSETVGCILAQWSSRMADCEHCERIFSAIFLPKGPNSV